MRLSFQANSKVVSKLVLVILSIGLLTSGISQQVMAQTPKQTACNCVIFRMDDVQDHWLKSVQTKIMDLFISKGQKFSLGIIMNYTGNDQTVIQKINQGKNSGLFELDIHGWNHVDYTKLSQQEQKNTLVMANSKMQSIFGIKSNVFIPPYDRFNNSTLAAMTDSGIKILSAAPGGKNDYRFIWSQNNTYRPYSIYQIPRTTDFMTEDQSGVWHEVSNSAILDSIDKSISDLGYAVVLLHPQNFAKITNNNSIDIVNQSQINNLSSLIDSILAKNIHITTFENVIVSNPPQTQVSVLSNSTAATNDTLKSQKAMILNIIQECHLEMKSKQHHAQIMHECKAKIKELSKSYKNSLKQLKIKFKQTKSKFQDEQE